MKEITDMIKSIQRQKNVFDQIGAIGNNAAFWAAITAQNKINTQFASLYGSNDIARNVTRQLKKSISVSMFLDNRVQERIADFDFLKHHGLPRTISSKLAEFARINPLLTHHLIGFATSQFQLSKSLGTISAKINQPHLNEFNGFDIALRGITKNYVWKTALSNDWEDITVAEEANEAILQVAEQVIQSASEVTAQDLDRLKEGIVSELSTILGKTKTDKARQLIFELLAIISFILTIYNPIAILTDKSNTQVIEHVQKEIEKQNKKLFGQMEEMFKKLSQISNARIDADLKFSARKNAKTIGKVKAGQQVTVIEIVNKYMLITFLDQETGEPKSGFVLKKHFDME
ncbi:carboxymuconolactone decarboxylase family protein [Flavitalea sp.]|nr:hypothetical protein [Flavitalea sp.]